MPSSTRTPTFKFLLDENVRIELFRFLKGKGIDVKQVSKGSSDQIISNQSKAEKRILVTNDEDFNESSKDEVYAIVWLKIAQNDKTSLLNSVNKLLLELKDFKDQLIVLYNERWEKFPLAEKA